MKRVSRRVAIAALPVALAAGYATAQTVAAPKPAAKAEQLSPDGKRYLAQPLVTEIDAADPSAHVFNGKIYV